MWADTATTHWSLFAPAMCFNVVQLCVSGWLRSMSAGRGQSAARSRWVYVRAKGGCHATDAVAAYGPDWQARLLMRTLHSDLPVLRNTATAMNTGQSDYRPQLHICMQAPEFIEEKHWLYEQGIFKSIDLPVFHVIATPTCIYLRLTHFPNLMYSIIPVRPHTLSKSSREQRND